MNCPFTNSNGGFTCTTGPTSTSNRLEQFRRAAPTTGYICPSVDYNSHTLYNGCWDQRSQRRDTASVLHGIASCTCPSGAPTTGANKCSCSRQRQQQDVHGPRYIHNWTQPGPTDTTHNHEPASSQPSGRFQRPAMQRRYPDDLPNPNPTRLGFRSNCDHRRHLPTTVRRTRHTTTGSGFHQPHQHLDRLHHRPHPEL